MTHIVQIPKPLQGRRFAIGDIHGCYETLRKLVIEQIQLTQEDQLFLLGDYIDRGPNSSGVIDWIIELKEKGFQVFTLRGNHEQMLIEDLARYNPKVFKRWLTMNNTLDLADESGVMLKPKYYRFIDSLPYCFELDEFYLVHAGFNFMKDSILEDVRAMIWVREMSIFPEMLNGKRFVHGHTPKGIDEIRHRIQERHVEICLDNGCVYQPKNRWMEREGDLGRLCALNLDTFELLEEMYCG
ncbi:MAG: metallophosphoesterase family protein [Flammeovirgaceae bacterium]